MKIDIPQTAVRRLSRMAPDEQREWILQCSPADLLILDAAYEAWIADGQIAPGAEGWRVWMMMAGRGFGKTRAGAEWVHRLALARPVRIALVAASIDEARAIMIEGRSGLLSVARRLRHKLKWEPSLGQLSWPKGSVAHIYSGDNANSLRGPEHHFAWCVTGAGRTRGWSGRKRPDCRSAGKPGNRKLLHYCR
jgi:phage terminase large subunit-like protein